MPSARRLSSNVESTQREILYQSFAPRDHRRRHRETPTIGEKKLSSARSKLATVAVELAAPECPTAGSTLPESAGENAQSTRRLVTSVIPDGSGSSATTDLRATPSSCSGTRSTMLLSQTRSTPPTTAHGNSRGLRGKGSRRSDRPQKRPRIGGYDCDMSADAPSASVFAPGSQRSDRGDVLTTNPATPRPPQNTTRAIGLTASAPGCRRFGLRRQSRHNAVHQAEGMENDRAQFPSLRV